MCFFCMFLPCVRCIAAICLRCSISSSGINGMVGGMCQEEETRYGGQEKMESGGNRRMWMDGAMDGAMVQWDTYR